jgi:lysophospholipase L1-like esterase
VAWPQPTYARMLNQIGGYYAPSDYNTFQLKSRYVGTEPSMDAPGTLVRVTTNSDATRGTELDAAEDKIVVMGDSYTFGMYVNDEETYPAVLERLVRRQHPHYQVVNAGFTDGWETDQHYVWLKHNIARLDPRILVLGVFLGNDINGIDPAAWSELDENGLPGRWHDASLEVTPEGFIKDRRTRAATTAAPEVLYRIPVVRDSHLVILAGRAYARLSEIAAVKQGFREESLQHIFGVYSSEFLAKEALFLKTLEAMKRMCESRGTPFIVALLPINFMVEREKLDKVFPGSRFRGRDPVYYDRLQPLLAERGIPVVNIEREMKRAGTGPYFPANGEVHFNPRGHALTAGKLYEFLAAGGYLRQPRARK